MSKSVLVFTIDSPTGVNRGGRIDPRYRRWERVNTIESSALGGAAAAAVAAPCLSVSVAPDCWTGIDCRGYSVNVCADLRAESTDGLEWSRKLVVGGKIKRLSPGFTDRPSGTGDEKGEPAR
jgi:hypothetical protein